MSQPWDQTPGKSNRGFSQWAECPNARMCQTAPCSSNDLGKQTLHEHGSSFQRGCWSAIWYHCRLTAGYQTAGFNFCEKTLTQSFDHFRTRFLYATRNNPVINESGYSNPVQYFIEDELFNHVLTGAVKNTAPVMLQSLFLFISPYGRSPFKFEVSHKWIDAILPPPISFFLSLYRSAIYVAM